MTQNLKSKIQDDMSAAIKSKDELRTSTLRLLKAAIMRFEVSGDKKKEALDEDVLKIIAKEAKQRKDSIDAYRKGDREDLAKKEESELKVLEGYLPEQISEQKLKEVVQEVIKEVGAQGKQDFGKVMGMAMGRVKGKADGAAVSRMVSAMLGSKNSSL